MDDIENERLEKIRHSLEELMSEGFLDADDHDIGYY